MKVRQTIVVIAVFVWMLMLHIKAHAALPDQGFPDLQRLKALNQIRSVNLSDFLPMPEIQLKPSFLELARLPDEVRVDPKFNTFKEILEKQSTDEVEVAYLDAERLTKSVRKTPLEEWLAILKADLLYQTLHRKKDGKLTFAIEEYQEINRRYPLSPERPRIIYQLCLLNLEQEFYDEVDALADRGVREFPKSAYAPNFLLVKAEKTFRQGKLARAKTEYSLVMDRFPRSRAAVDASFRMALMQFKEGDFSAALRSYNQLENFHSEEYQALREKSDSTAMNRIIDRAYYAESVYLNGDFETSSAIFQDLPNLFPKDPSAAFLLVRFADTFYQRGRFAAAERLYQSLAQDRRNPDAARAWAMMRKADLFFIARDVSAYKDFEDLYDQAYALAVRADHKDLQAANRAGLAAFYLFFKSYPNAQKVLRGYLKNFSQTRNQQWVEDRLSETIELEILDYAQRGDDLAVLATYLIGEKEKVQALQNTQVLFVIAESAKNIGLEDKTTELLSRIIYLEKSSEVRQEAILRLVELLIEKKETKKASERLRRFNFAYPRTSLTGLYNKLWGDLYTVMKQPEKAIHHYELALSEAEKDPGLLYAHRNFLFQMAQHYEELKLPLQAIEMYKTYAGVVKQIQASPTSTYRLTARDEFYLKISRYRVAEAFFTMKDYVKAIEAYQKVAEEVKEEPFHSHAQYRLGECYLALQDRMAALESFKSVASGNSQSLWAKAADSYIKTVEMEVKYGIRILN